MKYKANYGAGVINLPGRVGAMLRDIGMGELKMLVWLLSPERYGGDIDVAKAALDLGIDEAAARSAVNYLVSRGLLSPDGERPGIEVKSEDASTGKKVITVTSDDGPHYTGQEIERLFERDPKLGDYIDECQKTLGRMFTPHEINKLLALREYYGLDAEFVIIICGYCKGRSRGTVPYVERVTKNMTDLGITTVAALEDRISYLGRYDNTEALVRRLCGFGTRALTQKEKKFIEKWTELEFTADMVELAFEIAVNNTGSPSLPYMNKVLTNWQDSGYKTSAQILEGIEDYRRRRDAAGAQSAGSFKTDEFFEAALQRALKKHTSES